MTYPLTFYVKSLPNGFGGKAYGPVIVIIEKYRNDKGLHAHELTHVKQWVWTLGLLPFLYLIPKCKLWFEVQAYKEQMKHSTVDQSAFFGAVIATKYGLDILPSEATKLLKA
jgi:hypothetical protein